VSFDTTPDYSYTPGSSSDPNWQVSRKVAECANSCGMPNTKTCNGITYVKCCTN
jgi:hypothetical protein